LTAGEIIPVQESTLIPNSWRYREAFVEWLRESNLYFECPLTRTCYVSNYRSIDEFAEWPGFLETCKQMFDEEDWLMKLLASSKVQALAVAQLL